MTKTEKLAFAREKLLMLQNSVASYRAAAHHYAAILAEGEEDLAEQLYLKTELLRCQNKTKDAEKEIELISDLIDFYEEAN